MPQNLLVAVFESDPKFRHAWGHVRQGQNLAMSGDLLRFWRIFKKFSQSDLLSWRKSPEALRIRIFRKKRTSTVVAEELLRQRSCLNAHELIMIRVKYQTKHSGIPPGLWLEPKLAVVANEPENHQFRHHPNRLDIQILVHPCFLGKWLNESSIHKGLRAFVD
jgi:hypothetical protein